MKKSTVIFILNLNILSEDFSVINLLKTEALTHRLYILLGKKHLHSICMD